MQGADDQDPNLQRALEPRLTVQLGTKGPHFQHNTAVPSVPHATEVEQAWKLPAASAMESWAPVIR